MIRRRALHADARRVARLVAHDGRTLTITVSPSARRVYLDGAGLFALGARELDELRAALADAARALDAGDAL